MMTTNVAEAKKHLGALLGEVASGVDVLLCKRNRPIAMLTRVPAGDTPNRTRLGSARGSVEVHCDLTESAIPATDWEMPA